MKSTASKVELLFVLSSPSRIQDVATESPERISGSSGGYVMVFRMMKMINMISNGNNTIAFLRMFIHTLMSKASCPGRLVEAPPPAGMMMPTAPKSVEKFPKRSSSLECAILFRHLEGTRFIKYLRMFSNRHRLLDGTAPSVNSRGYEIFTATLLGLHMILT